MKVKLFQTLESRFQKLIGYLAIFLIVLMVISIVKNIGRVGKIRSEVGREVAKIEKIKLENEGLERQISEAQGVEFIEKQLRNKLGLVKEGEVVVVLPDKEILKKFAPKAYEEEESLPDPNWKRWLKLFL